MLNRYLESMVRFPFDSLFSEWDNDISPFFFLLSTFVCLLRIKPKITGEKTYWLCQYVGEYDEKHDAELPETQRARADFECCNFLYATKSPQTFVTFSKFVWKQFSLTCHC